jgi:hypothetical protein
MNDVIGTWAESVRHYWDKNSGVVGGDKEFWRNCMTNDQLNAVATEWQDWYVDNYQEYWDRAYPHWADDTAAVLSRLRSGLPIMHPNRKNAKDYNLPAYRWAMTVKDAYGRAIGEPFTTGGNTSNAIFNKMRETTRPKPRSQLKDALERTLEHSRALTDAIEELYNSVE